MNKRLLTLLSILALSVSATLAEQKDEMRLRYNRTDLTVDLGTGLWGTPIPVDYDGDGLIDLLVTTPDTPFKGIYLFKNIGSKSNPLFEAPIRLSDRTHKNLHASYYNGELVVMRPGYEFEGFAENIFAKPKEIAVDVVPGADFGRARSNMWAYVDYFGDGSKDIIVGVDTWDDYGWDNAYDESGKWTNGPLRGYIYLLKEENGKYVNKGRIQAGGKDLETFGAPSANMYDFDGDGKKDIIAGEFLDKLTFFKNIGTVNEPKFAEGEYLRDKKGEIITMYTEMITPVGVDFDGDGHVDLIVGDEDGRIAWLKNTGKRRKGVPLFDAPIFLQQKAEYVKFGALSTPFSVDWDGDGHADIISGNSSGDIAFIKNRYGGTEPEWDKPQLLQVDGKNIRIMAGENGSIQGPAEAKWGYTTLSVADWDGDGRADIVVNSIFGEVVWYRNSGSVTQLEGPFKVKVDWGEQPTPKPSWNWWSPERTDLVTQWRTTPMAIDWNGDGLMDLVMLDQEGYLSYYERFEKGGELWLKPGKRIFFMSSESKFDHNNNLIPSKGEALQLNVGVAGRSGRRKLCMVDWDGDGDLDLIVNSLSVSLFENVLQENGEVYFKNKGMLSDVRLAGHDTSPTPVDWNLDGIVDLLVGAEDGHFYIIKNNLK